MNPLLTNPVYLPIQPSIVACAAGGPSIGGRRSPVIRRSAWAALSLLLLVLMGWISTAMAQDETAISTDEKLQLSEGVVQSQQRVWIQGRDGRPLLRYTLEELQELERVYREATQLPAFLGAAKLKVQVAGSAAAIEAEFEAETTGSGTVTHFDLGLKNSQLTARPELEPAPDPTEPDPFRMVPTADGYRWLLLDRRGGVHRLRVAARTLVQRASDRHNLSIDLPLVNSTIIVRLPPNAVEERIRGEDLLVRRAVDDEAVELEIQSRGGNFSLSWREGQGSAHVGAE